MGGGSGFVSFVHLAIIGWSGLLVAHGNSWLHAHTHGGNSCLLYCLLIKTFNIMYKPAFQITGGLTAPNWPELWRQLQYEVTLGNSNEWEEAGVIRKTFRQVR